MSIFGFLLIFFLIYFVIWPLVRTSMRVRSAMKQMRDMADRAQRAAGAGFRTAADSAAGRRRRKKIDPSVGEYVEFEEISGSRRDTVESDGAGNVRYSSEQQIVDAEWVDIPSDK